MWEFYNFLIQFFPYLLDLMICAELSEMWICFSLKVTDVKRNIFVPPKFVVVGFIDFHHKENDKFLTRDS